VTSAAGRYSASSITEEERCVSEVDAAAALGFGPDRFVHFGHCAIAAEQQVSNLCSRVCAVG
jgi:hypothetical protein